jgi:uncharacterized protein (TIGR02147 family)
VTEKSLPKSAATPAPDRYDYRESLRRVFSARVRANARYSLRAFARDLRLSTAQTSYVLSGKKGLSPRSAELVARRLGLSPGEIELFVASAVSQHARSAFARTAAHTKLDSLTSEASETRLGIDAFQVVSEWYHFALLQILQLRGAKSDSAWLAAKLGISIEETEGAIERLLRLELLERSPSGRIRASNATVLAPGGVPSEAIRKFHRQVIAKAVQAIDEQSVDLRYLESTLIPVRRADFAAATRAIADFHRRFDRKYTAVGDGDAVYALAIQFFDLTPSSKPRSPSL